MAKLTVEYVSNALKRSVTFSVLLPTDRLDYQKGYAAPEKNGYKTLYLLHGLLGSHTDWNNGTRIQLWAQERNLAVIMPSGENSFYVDQPVKNHDFGTFIGQELVEISRRMFPLSTRREDTFIGGLSMGGFGALRNGLKYADTFGRIISLSAALHIFENPQGTVRKTIFEEDNVFGDISAAKLTEKNPRVAAEKLLQQRDKGISVELPKIYMACGRQDGLYPFNVSFKNYLNEAGYEVTWEEEDGIHDWYYWDRKIHDALSWLPLTGEQQGMNSGNVS